MRPHSLSIRFSHKRSFLGACAALSVQVLWHAPRARGQAPFTPHFSDARCGGRTNIAGYVQGAAFVRSGPLVWEVMLYGRRCSVRLGTCGFGMSRTKGTPWMKPAMFAGIAAASVAVAG